MMEQQQLADAAAEDLHAAIQAARQVPRALADPQASPQAVAELQQVYLARTGELRNKLRALFEMRASAGTQQQDQDVAMGDAPQLAELQERKQQLVQQVCAASELEAELMGQLRGLLDSFALWDAHKKHLEAPAPTTR